MEPGLLEKLWRITLGEERRDKVRLASKRDFRQVTELLKDRVMKFGHMKCPEPSFTSLHGIFRKHPFLAYVFYYMRTNVSKMHQRIECCSRLA